MSGNKEDRQECCSLVCARCNRSFESHPYSDELCPYCYSNRIDRRYADYVRPLISDGVFSEPPNPDDSLHPKDRSFVIELCKQVVFEVIESSVRAFNESIHGIDVKSSDESTKKTDLEAEVRQVIRNSTQHKAANNEDSSSRDTVEWFTATTHIAIAERRLWRRYLRRRCGFDTTRARWIDNKGLTAHEFNCFMLAWREYNFRDQLFLAATNGVTSLILRGMSVRTNIKEVSRLMHSWVRDEPFAWHLELLKTPHPNYDAAAWTYFCSEVRKGIKRFPRLRATFENETPSEFLSRVVLSLLETRDQEPLEPAAHIRQLVNHVTRQMTREHRTIVSTEDLPDDSLEQFALREEARIDIELLTRAAKLSPREGELLALKLKHPDATSAELGAMMNISTGTIDSKETRTLKKLRRTARQK